MCQPIVAGIGAVINMTIQVKPDEWLDEEGNSGNTCLASSIDIRLATSIDCSVTGR